MTGPVVAVTPTGAAAMEQFSLLSAQLIADRRRRLVDEFGRTRRRRPSRRHDEHPDPPTAA